MKRTIPNSRTGFRVDVSKITLQIFTISLFITISLFPGGRAAYGETAEKNWKNQAELTLVQTQGNSEIKTFQFKDKQSNTFSDTLSSELKFETLYSKALGEATAERYTGEGRGDYKLGEKLSTALKAGWKRDRFTGIDNRYYLGPILGYRFLAGPHHYLKTELNADWVYQEYTKEFTDENDKADEDFLSAGLFGEYEWTFSEKSKFTQSVAVFRDFNEQESYQIESITALITQLNSYFSFKTTYQVNHNTDPIDDDLKKTDTSLTVSLVADF